MFGHPLHPISVHLPVVLLVGGVLIDLASTLPPWYAWRKAGFFHLVLGTLGAVLALVTGAVDAGGVTTPDGGTVLGNHALFAILATGLFGMMLFVRLNFRNRRRQAGATDLEAEVPRTAMIVYFTLAALGVAFMAAAGFTGGELVYGQGVGVR